MKKYRIKKEAVPFISENHITKIDTLDFWESIGLSKNALEEVEPVFLTYGDEKEIGYTSLSQWDSKDGSKLKMTIHFPSLKYNEHNRFTKGTMVRKLIDEIQDTANSFCDNFLKDFKQ